MIAAKQTFINGIQSTKTLFSFYEHLRNVLHIPDDEISDLLRSQIVYAVSAFDRLIHELVRVGVLEIFNEKRVPTEKFKNQPFRAHTFMNVMKSLKSASPPTSPDDIPEVIINKEIIEKLSFFAFQAPDKVKDALSFIWNEPQKMVILANEMKLPGTTDNEKQKKLVQTLQLIANRRNQIVHEADIEPLTNKRRNITRTMIEDNINFIESLGLAIFKVVTDPSCYLS